MIKDRIVERYSRNLWKICAS